LSGAAEKEFIKQAHQGCLMSQRTGAELNHLNCDMPELEFAMEVGAADYGLARFGQRNENA